MFPKQIDEISLFVNNINKSANEKLEIEARVNYNYLQYDDKKLVKVPAPHWNNLRESLIKVGLKENIENYKSIIYGSTNHRESIHDSGHIYQYKYSYDPITIDLNHWIVYSISKEGTISEIQFKNNVEKVAEKNIIIRNIRRHTFELTGCLCKVDMSFVTTNSDESGYEVEIEFTGEPNPNNYDKFINGCRYVVMLMNGSMNYYNKDQLYGFNMFINMNLGMKTLNEDDSLRCGRFVDLRFFSQVSALELNDLQNGAITGERYTTYTISDKIDGENRKLIIGPCGLWIIYPPYHINLVDIPCGRLFRDKELTILDGELVPMQNRQEGFDHSSAELLFIVSDVIMVAGKDVRIMNKSERLTRGSTYIKNIFATRSVNGINLPDGNILQIIWKEQKVIKNKTDLFSKVVDLLARVDDNQFSNGVLTDGLIFAPENFRYTSQFINMDKDTPVIYKWKPPHLVTIDFRIKYIKNEIGTYEYALYYDNRTEKEPEDEVEFIGNRKYPFNRDMIDTTSLKEEYINQIGEFHWVAMTNIESLIKQSKMILKFIRYNKSSANAKITTMSNWNLMNEPISSDTMCGIGLQQMYYHHNRIKDYILNYQNNSVPKNGRVLLDLGTGRGGDIKKWKLYSVVIAVEPIEAFIIDLISRAKNSGYIIIDHNYDHVSAKTLDIDFTKKTLVVVRAFAQDTDKIEIVVRNVYAKFDNKSSHKCDAVSIMNSATFFWESPEVLKSVVETIKTLLTPGGTIVWMMMDGDAVRYRMGSFNPRSPKTSVLQYGGFSIIGKRDNNGNLQREVSITLPDSKTVSSGQEEYLTSFPDLLKLLWISDNKIDVSSFTEVIRFRADESSLTGSHISPDMGSNFSTMGHDSLSVSSLYHYGIIKRYGETTERKLTPNKEEIFNPIIKTSKFKSEEIQDDIIKPRDSSSARTQTTAFEGLSSYIPFSRNRR